MLRRATDPTCYLIETSDVHQDPMPDLLAANIQPVMEILSWAREYLCAPHEQLGRDGPVCPFVPFSMHSRLFYITVQRGQHFNQQTVCDTVMQYRDWFLELEPTHGHNSRYKTILILFPDVLPEDAPTIIDATQYHLKPKFVAEGLMIGQFHPLPPAESGLWNADFRPLKSPIPLLAIRHMVATDFPFLMHDSQFVTSYLRIFGNNISKKQQAAVKRAILRFGLDSASDQAE